jgi:hypothetical protein
MVMFLKKGLLKIPDPANCSSPSSPAEQDIRQVGLNMVKFPGRQSGNFTGRLFIL